MMTNKKVLIAGCGDLGVKVAALLLQDHDVECWGLRRHPPAGDALTHGRLKWISADVSDAGSLANLPEGIADLVYCAAPGERSEDAYSAVYLHGLQNVVREITIRSESKSRSAFKLNRIVFVSSTAVYGDHGDAWIDESTPTAPKAFNGRILVETEQWLDAYAAAHTGVKATSARLSGIYGPGRNHLIEKLRHGQATAPEGLTHWVNRIHIDDAAAAIVHILNLPQPAPLYLVTDSTPLPMRTLYDELARLVGAPSPAIGPAPASVGSKRLSNQRLIDSGFTFKWPDCRIGHAALLAKS